MIEQNFIKLFEDSFKNNWELPALSDYKENNTYTYGQLAAKIARTHLFFEAMGIEKGDKIALIGKNHTSWGLIFLSTITYGAVIVPILPDFHPESLVNIILHSESKLAFIQNKIWDSLNAEQIKIPVFANPSLEALANVDDEKRSIWESVEKAFNEKYPTGFRKEHIVYPKIDNQEVICINYTSGTTGFSKGVMLTANNYAGNITFAHHQKLLLPGGRDLAFLPLAHAYGCAFDFLYALSEGVHVTLLGIPPTPKNLLGALQEVKPDIIITVPLILEKIYKKNIQPVINNKFIKPFIKIPCVYINQKVPHISIEKYTSYQQEWK